MVSEKYNNWIVRKLPRTKNSVVTIHCFEYSKATGEEVASWMSVVIMKNDMNV